MATLTVQNISRAGVVPSYAAAAGGGDAAALDANTFLHVKNGGGSSITVTVTPPATVNPLPNVAYAAVAVSVANGSEKMIGPFPAEFFNDPSTGLAAITYSGVTSVTVAAIKLTKP